MEGSIQNISERELVHLLETEEFSPAAWILVKEIIRRFEQLERTLENERNNNASA
jgi:hypothetical protein